MKKDEIKIRIKLWKAVKVEFNRKIKEYPNRSGNSLCWTLDDVYGQFRDKYGFRRPYYTDLAVYYPELWKYKPTALSRRYANYWWSYKTRSGEEKRLQVIDNIINDLKQLLKQS